MDIQLNPFDQEELQAILDRLEGTTPIHPGKGPWTGDKQLALVAKVKNLLAQYEPANDIPEAEIFGTNTCPYCDKAKAYLDELGISYVFKNIDEDDEAFDQLVGRIKSWKTVPQIFMKGQHVGGYDDLRAFILATAK